MRLSPSWSLFRRGIEAIVSEPDQGMYDAMNKGVQRASGEVIAILNSDDVYADAAVLARGWQRVFGRPSSGLRVWRPALRRRR